MLLQEVLAVMLRLVRDAEHDAPDSAAFDLHWLAERSRAGHGRVS